MLFDKNELCEIFTNASTHAWQQRLMCAISRELTRHSHEGFAPQTMNGENVCGLSVIRPNEVEAGSICVYSLQLMCETSKLL